MKHTFGICWIWILLLSAVEGNCTEIRVRPGVNSLRMAIGRATAGDTLLIQAGLYREHDLTIDKKLTLIGAGYPHIDGENRYQLLLVTADGVSISGLQLQHVGKASLTDMAGIKVIGAKNVTISNNHFFNNTFGVYLQNASQCRVVKNLIHCDISDEVNGGNGIHAWKSDHLTIERNTISGQRDGIYFEFVTESYIRGNRSFRNARYGLHFMFSHHDTYTQNVFQDNGAGVAVMYSKGVIMRDNLFLHNWGDSSYGLLLKEITDSYIEHNRFVKNTIGLHMESTTRVEVKRNLFQENGWAARVQASCSGSDFTANNFIGNSFDVATNGTMMLNTFNRNYWDKYDGYDLNRNQVGDVPYYPVSVYSVITEKIPVTMILYHSLLSDIMDQVEKVMPTVIPDKLRDNEPLMKKITL
ncbi:nitrous oxide reductase family maturation protein NosD [Mucilaginibacter sp. HC2]|jgi:nitrous oxidase accessory protein|uniref:nitrous oxide reductase family maturation protein NosD n=1 Tax=Mucilaginibacter inviolabilis TaxID=2714892 RepID=UPI0014098DD8|nr:nitrous oxide reductase family maturation protein NosD [Mucilaginibacter inviolabilis]NHA02587.1 nitrous oxide reductase family maturation protein NosD [Mucilaginibacter inviolabilis]